MESCTASLTFKGSISEAIKEAQEKKKLFLVYISGGHKGISITTLQQFHKQFWSYNQLLPGNSQLCSSKDSESGSLVEQSVWLDANVVESISKNCVFLHLLQGSVDASNFSAIYPQNSIPNISAIGYYGGKLLWQLEGQVTAENLAAAIEKSWASLQLQESAAAVLSAALAARKPGISGTDTSNVPSSSNNREPQESEVRPSLPPKVETEISNKAAGETSENPARGVLKLEHDKESQSTVERTEKEVTLETADVHSSGAQWEPTTRSVESNTSEEDIALETLKSCKDPIASTEGNTKIVNNRIEGGEYDGLHGLDSGKEVVKSNDVHLSIRLPNGSTLQSKFLVTDSLTVVKNYVDGNQMSGIGPYDLAIPYPRKVFSNEDLSRSLSELGLVSREALIVVPHHSPRGLHKGKEALSKPLNIVSGADSSSEHGGYFGYLKRMLSYVNPFSYFGGTPSPSNAEATPGDGMWQYRPNPALQNSLSGGDRSYRPYSPNVQTSPYGESASRNRNATTRQIGRNIHTLRHDEDDPLSGDRNAFWNGNSTQYGGDGKN